MVLKPTVFLYPGAWTWQATCSASRACMTCLDIDTMREVTCPLDHLRPAYPAMNPGCTIRKLELGLLGTRRRSCPGLYACPTANVFENQEIFKTIYHIF